MGKINDYLKEGYAGEMWGRLSTEKYQAPGVDLESSAHSHDIKLRAGHGISTVGGMDSHNHIIVDGVVKGANNHAHSIDKLYNSREEFVEDLSDSNPLKMYNKFNIA